MSMQRVFTCKTVYSWISRTHLNILSIGYKALKGKGISLGFHIKQLYHDFLKKILLLPYETCFLFLNSANLLDNKLDIRILSHGCLHLSTGHLTYRHKPLYQRLEMCLKNVYTYTEFFCVE